jgi:hypothetical protein
MGGVFSILSVSITDTKVMPEIAAIKIRAKYETILIDFVRVVRNKTNSCCESILSNYIPFNEHGLKRLAVAKRHSLCVHFCWCGGC